jgi:hypothetical protein
MQERRRNRSESPEEAARLFLQSIAARRGLAALALTNDDGLLIAAATAPGTDIDDLGWIGAVGSVCAGRGRRGPSLGSLVERLTGGLHLAATEMVLRGERLYLTAVGGSVPSGREVVEGIERILAASLPAVA